MHRQPDRVAHAALVVCWLVLPVTAGDPLADALAGRPGAVPTVGALGAWAGWAASLVALLVPSTVSLTALRVLVPAAAVATGWALATQPSEAVGVAGPAGLAAATAAAALVLTAAVGDRFVNGSAYGHERRFALRPPLALLLGPLPLTWLVVVGGAVSGPLLLAAGQWIAGTVALALGWPAAWLGVRRAHVLATRWLVLVPAGVVVHDPMVLADSFLALKRRLRRVAPAPADSTALDLTMGATGLALEIAVREPQAILTQRDRRAAGGSLAATREVDAVLVAPSRPGAVMRAVRERGFPVG